MASVSVPFDSVPNAFVHLEDFQLVQRCLDRDPDALQQLLNVYRPQLIAYLKRAGATDDDADEIVTELWADCVVSPPGELPRIARYDGSCALSTWLGTVSFNRLVTLKRKQKRREQLGIDSLDSASGLGGDETLGDRIPAPDEISPDAPLVQLLRDAVQAGFEACTAEQFVMLQLAYADGLRANDLAIIWRCNPGTMSRRLEEARETVAKTVIKYVRTSDRWIDLDWTDYLHLCRSMSLGALGFD